MLSQARVDRHLSKVRDVGSVLLAAVGEEVDAVVSDVVDHVLRSLVVKKGTVVHSARNVELLLGIEAVFLRILDRSNFYIILSAFASDFVYQVDDFFDMSEEMGLPSVSLTHDDMEALSAQVAASLSIMEGEAVRVNLELRRLLAMSLGDQDLAGLVKGISEVIQKLTKVVPIAVDQCITWFRVLGNLWYRNIEALGVPLLYSYVGAGGEREFCSDLIESGAEHTRDSIEAMSNNQVVDCFNGCGGYGCMHFWSARAA